MQNLNKKKYKGFKGLINIIELLREKCPWDKKQTFETLRHLTIEEVYELSDSIIENDVDNLKEEIGDILLHIILYSIIGKEKNFFGIEEVIENLIEKLIRRHPHIFGDKKIISEEDIIKQWEAIKKSENKSTFGGVPKNLPSLIKAKRVQEKASARGFDWELKSESWEKVEEEIEELKIEEERNDQEKIKDEFGDILFALVNYSRFLKIDPEEALEKSNKKFIRRYKKVEDIIEKENLKIEKMNAQELNNIWEKAKSEVD